MKILIACSTIDLKYKLGCTPSWWQLFKAFHELGHEVVITPYLGDPVDSLWWRSYPNPMSSESKMVDGFLNFQRKIGGSAGRGTQFNSLVGRVASRFAYDAWSKHLDSILNREKDVDALFVMNVPLNHIKGVPSMLKQEFDIPMLYYDGDMPTILPKYALDRGFKFNYYEGADLSEYDAFFTNSKGVIPDLRDLNAHNISPLYYAIDPELFKPMDVPKTIDISFFGYGSQLREEWMTKMITEPSQAMPGHNFSVGGGKFGIDLGNARMVGDLSYNDFRKYCCASKICLNITRWSHTKVYASSTARPFELAGFGACVVSQPYNGLEEWFTPGKELIVLSGSEDVNEVYSNLLESPEEMTRLGENMRARALRDHTFQNRANEIINKIKAISA